MGVPVTLDLLSHSNFIEYPQFSIAPDIRNIQKEYFLFLSTKHAVGTN